MTLPIELASGWGNACRVPGAKHQAGLTGWCRAQALAGIQRFFIDFYWLLVSSANAALVPILFHAA